MTAGDWVFLSIMGYVIHGVLSYLLFRYTHKRNEMGKWTRDIRMLGLIESAIPVIGILVSCGYFIVSEFDSNKPAKW